MEKKDNMAGHTNANTTNDPADAQTKSRRTTLLEKVTKENPARPEKHKTFIEYQLLCENSII